MAMHKMHTTLFNSIHKAWVGVTMLHSRLTRPDVPQGLKGKLP